MNGFDDYETEVCPECGGVRGVFCVSAMQIFPCDTCCGYGFIPDFKRPKRKENKMNYSTAVMLFNPEIRAVAVSYERDHNGEGKKPFITFKTLDATIAPKDMVVVPTGTRHNFTVVRVEKIIDVDTEIDFEDDTQVNWIASKIDLAAHEKLLAQETAMINTMKAAEKKHKTDQIRSKVQEFYKEAELPKLALIGSAPEMKSE